MTEFRNVVFVAAIAGALAGLLLAFLQITTTAPLILKAETYEQAGAGHSHGDSRPAENAESTAAGQSHSHDDAGWAPRDGLERTAYTVGANIVTAIGFALLLVAVSEFAGGIASWRQGLIWGIAGFAVFTLAPGLGLPPELPAMPAADLVTRQAWWMATVAGTASGLALLVFGRKWFIAGAGVALLILPHVIGAPLPEQHDTPVPAALHREFVAMVTVSSLLFWLVLGATAGALRHRFMGHRENAQTSPA